MPEYQIHPIPPVYDQRSRVLILGSFPSARSREAGFFYGHPQNRFWQVLSDIFNEPLPTSTDSKRIFLLSHRIALWDVIASCRIVGSADSSIRNVMPNDLSRILNHAPIQFIYTNGKTAKKDYDKYQLPQTGIEAVALPSTSPANASFGLAKLTDRWRIIAASLSST